MLSLDQYFIHDGKDRREVYACDFKPNFEINATRLLLSIDALLAVYEADQGLPEGSYKVNSGWRPPSVNACTKGASVTSLHMICRAADLDDDNGALNTWLLTPLGQKTMLQLGLFHEHPDNTPRWCHLQDVPQRSFAATGKPTFRAK